MKICRGVFWALSRTTKALLKVRPRMNVSGATSLFCGVLRAPFPLVLTFHEGRCKADAGMARSFVRGHPGENQELTGFHCGSGQNNARYLLLLEGRNRHGHGEVSFSRASRSDSKNNIVLLNCLDVRPLVCASRYNRGFARRGGDFR